MSRRKKKKSRAGLIVLLLLFVALALVLALRAFDVIPIASPDPTPTTYEEHFGDGGIIRPLQTPESDGNELPDPSAQTPAPGAQPAEGPQEAIILENHGDLEIILPEGMESGGF